MMITKTVFVCLLLLLCYAYAGECNADQRHLCRGSGTTRRIRRGWAGSCGAHREGRRSDGNGGGYGGRRRKYEDDDGKHGDGYQKGDGGDGGDGDDGKGRNDDEAEDEEYVYEPEAYCVAGSGCDTDWDGCYKKYGGCGGGGGRGKTEGSRGHDRWYDNGDGECRGRREGPGQGGGWCFDDTGDACGRGKGNGEYGGHGQRDGYGRSGGYDGGRGNSSGGEDADGCNDDRAGFDGGGDCGECSGYNAKVHDTESGQDNEEGIWQDEGKKEVKLYGDTADTVWSGAGGMLEQMNKHRNNKDHKTRINDLNGLTQSYRDGGGYTEWIGVELFSVNDLVKGYSHDADIVDADFSATQFVTDNTEMVENMDTNVDEEEEDDNDDAKNEPDDDDGKEEKKLDPYRFDDDHDDEFNVTALPKKTKSVVLDIEKYSSNLAAVVEEDGIDNDDEKKNNENQMIDINHYTISLYKLSCSTWQTFDCITDYLLPINWIATANAQSTETPTPATTCSCPKSCPSSTDYAWWIVIIIVAGSCIMSCGCLYRLDCKYFRNTSQSINNAHVDLEMAPTSKSHKVITKKSDTTSQNIPTSHNQGMSQSKQQQQPTSATPISAAPISATPISAAPTPATVETRIIGGIATRIMYQNCDYNVMTSDWQFQHREQPLEISACNVRPYSSFTPSTRMSIRTALTSTSPATHSSISGIIDFIMTNEDSLRNRGTAARLTVRILREWIEHGKGHQLNQSVQIGN